MKYFTAILYARDGTEIDRCADCEGIRNAKERARYLLSDTFAQHSETTHAAFQTMKAAVFADGDKTGADALCEWDAEHPQHAAYVKEQNRLADLAEQAQLERERADEHTESERAEMLEAHTARARHRPAFTFEPKGSL
jgi:hypothetical protein